MELYNETECNKHGWHGMGACEDCEMEKRLFLTWRFNGRKYLALNLDGKVSICDELGNNYGSWLELSTFRKRQESGDENSWSALGKVRLIMCAI